MKRSIILLLFLIVLFCGIATVFLEENNAFLAEATTAFSLDDNASKEYKAVEKCPIYSSQNAASTIIYQYEKNQEVLVLDTQTINNVIWHKVNSPNGEGYTEAFRLYQFRPSATYSFRSASISAQSAGETIYLYDLPDGSVVLTVYDGANITVLAKGEEYSSIIYQGEKYYIKNVNVASGLSYYQRIALIIGCIAVGAVVLTGGLAYINKNKVARKN